MKLTGYVRVSTTEQVESGQGLAIQKAAIRKWCKTNRHQLMNVHRDEAASGYDEIRDGLIEALGDIKYNDAEGLVVANTGRLARDSFVQEWAMREVWKTGGKVFATDRGEVLEDDPERPMDTFVRKLFALVDELEGRMISLRLRRGRAHKAANGGYIGGIPPYGYLAEAGQLVEHEEEQEVLAIMRQMRKDGDSLRTIIRYLDDEGIPSKRGGQWHPATLNRILDQDPILK